MIVVNKEKCKGCGVCVQNCPKAVRMGPDGKAQIFNQKELEICGGKSVCPFGTMEDEEKNQGQKEEMKNPNLSENTQEMSPRPFSPSQSRRGGMRMGRGRGRGQGQGLGRGTGRGAGRRLGRGRI